MPFIHLDIERFLRTNILVRFNTLYTKKFITWPVVFSAEICWFAGIYRYVVEPIYRSYEDLVLAGTKISVFRAEMVTIMVYLPGEPG